MAKSLTEILTLFCNKKDRRIARPFGYERHGIKYAGATDGHVCVLIKSDEIFEPLSFDLSTIFKMYQPGKPVDFAALKKFAGKAKYPQTCRKCEGAGMCSHCEAECYPCDGAGVIYPDQRPGIIGPMWINRNLLARPLEIVRPVEIVDVTVGEKYGRTNKDTSPIYIVAPDWQIILMAITPGVTTQGVPVFELPA